jgi:serine kinase of HPr protein (carbohydrate metabolism regulator)
MVLSFSETCIVKLINCPKKVQRFLSNESIMNHQVHQNYITHNIEVEFSKLTEKKVIQNLHPNAFVTSRGFAFHDKDKNLIYPDYCFVNVAKILVDKAIEPAFFWEILFDHIKISLLKNNTITLHAAGLEKNNVGYLFFGWDGTGKSSILLDSIANDCRYLGDDRIFLTAEGNVLPLFSSIKQFHHELLNYQKLFDQLNTSKRAFIKLSQKIEELPTKFKLLKKIGTLLLKVFRKYKLNYVVIKAHSHGEIYNKSYDLDKVFFINKRFEDLSDEIDLTNILRSITSNIVYADIEMIKRYNTALFSGKINSVECIEKMNEYIYNILSKNLSKFKFDIININKETEISSHLWEY